MKKWILIVILIFGFLLRIYNLSTYPVGFTPDEASYGYDAYSLLNTGKDQWGQTLPITLRSFGDFKQPLYAYLAIPTVAIFGLNEFATRLPNAVVGTLAILATYLLARKLFDTKVALFSAVLIAISPWHVSLSRGAFEANLTTFFLPFGIWSYMQGIKERRYMIFSVLAFGLNLFSYHSARFVTPIIVLILIFITRQELGSVRKVIKNYRLPLVIALIFTILVVLSILGGAGTRGGDIAIFNPTGGWGSTADRRFEAINLGLPDIFSRLFSNKFTYILGQFITSYISYFSSQFLFTQGAGESTYGMIPGRGVVYLFEIFFLITVLISLKKSINKTPIKLLILWILISPIVAAFTKGPGFAANRTAVMMPALQILSAYGGVLLFQFLQSKYIKSVKILSSIYAIVILIFFIGFLEDYFYHAPIHGAQSMLYGRGEAIKKVYELQNNYSSVIISRQLSEPQMYLAFYTKWDPVDFQKQSQKWLGYERLEHPFVDQLGEYNLGKYIFKNIDYSKDSEILNVLMLGKSSEFPKDIQTLKTVNLPNGKKELLLVDPLKSSYASN